MLIQKNVIVLSILGGSMAFAQNIVHQPINPNGVTPVHTSLDHISVLQLPEKITRVAAGSDAMQIEWHDNSVFIKPLKPGQATNLMVWTEHQFSTYELEAPGDVRSMSFVIDETTPLDAKSSWHSEAAAAVTPSPQEIQRITDSSIGSTLLEVTPVVARGVRPAKDHVSVLIKEVVRDKNSLYVRFAVSNTGSHPYRIVSPNVFTIIPTKNAELIAGLKNLQIPEQATYQFQSGETSQVKVRGTALPEKDVPPGATVEGVLALEPADVQKAGVYEFIFGNDGTHRILATAVL
jgi:Conjugal transfer protein